MVNIHSCRQLWLPMTLLVILVRCCWVHPSLSCWSWQRSWWTPSLNQFDSPLFVAPTLMPKTNQTTRISFGFFSSFPKIGKTVLAQITIFFNNLDDFHLVEINDQMKNSTAEKKFPSWKLKFSQLQIYSSDPLLK